MVVSRFHSKWKIYFNILLIVFGIAFLTFCYLKIDIFLTKQHIDDQQDLLQKQTKQLEAYTLITWYNKLQAVKILEEKQLTMPWSDYITKVIAMLENMKQVNTSDSDAILLSDFNVSMDKITLKWQVSDLLLLYYSNATKGVQSLIDRFSALDFVQNIRIQTYDRIAESTYYQFVLEANVINDAGTGNTTK